MDKNFEKELGRKLSERTITPSVNAWERVKLQRERKPKKRTYIYWMAATLVLALGMTVFFNTSRQAEVTPTVVNNEKNASEITSPKSSPEVVTPIEIASQQTSGRAKQPKRNPSALPEYKILPREAALTIASADLTHLQTSLTITSKVQVAIKSDTKESADDVDLLIQKARKEIAAGRGLSKPTDANALLKASESELDESFRSGIIENVFKQKRIRVAFGNN